MFLCELLFAARCMCMYERDCIVGVNATATIYDPQWNQNVHCCSVTTETEIYKYAHLCCVLCYIENNKELVVTKSLTLQISNGQSIQHHSLPEDVGPSMLLFSTLVYPVQGHGTLKPFSASNGWEAWKSVSDGGSTNWKRTKKRQTKFLLVWYLGVDGEVQDNVKIETSISRTTTYVMFSTKAGNTL